MSTRSTRFAGSTGTTGRIGAVLAAAVLTAGPAVALAAAPAAYATGDDAHGHGTSGAVVLRTALDVNLLDKSLNVPVRAVLNEVHAPASADKTALTVRLDGIDGGRPVSLLRADVATARATADGRTTEGHANLVRAKVQLPGLPALPLAEVQQVTARAVCTAGQHPRAESQVLGDVVVLGKRVALRAGGTTEVDVPGVGDVRLDLSQKSTTSASAAATALQLRVSVNPLKLNVAEVHGQVTLAQATCTTPHGTPDKPGTPAHPGQPHEPGTGTQAHTGGGARPATENLAETGGSAATPYLIGGAVLLVAGGAGAMVYTRRRSAAPDGRG
ncbi:SCO1860 family LAETG-anchored protein [Streptomyces yunnanensis]|uniref:LPXTG-motif cell wall anchor domain-containing protein n=1 Tax=Streptomyces yunnanensis TaxID=156453 RepID=A0A9X8QT50_9ACTN|nr:SCO1860 family LAETG-anchored protein [Streptomyces yunnanensis]SHL91262.1 LPXTG-motif cell wall anchor domain-containing protein [Streptomyces yunnanensis]